MITSNQLPTQLLKAVNIFVEVKLMKTPCNHAQLRLFLNGLTIIVLVLLLTHGCAQTVLDSNEAQQISPFVKWQHSGAVYIITTPNGANLPASASETHFPLLVRLHKDFFDFGQAKANGEDIRFATSSGLPLAYQIDEWDTAVGTAGIWVRIPTIKGNAQQEIKMFWGKADAASESSGKAVFNESNGYLSVWHMDDPVKDEVGTLEAKDAGTTPSSGMIGKSRRFEEGKGINCGESIPSYPTGSSPHSSEAWFRAEQPNATVLAWGNEAGQGKVMLQYFSPPHMKIECYFSGADVRGGSTLPASQWIQVVHAFKNGDSRVYVNGILDGVSTSAGAPMAIKSPVRMYIGGWYNNYRFVGDIDEVRISKVTRSADWIRLQYENQKSQQSLVGPVVQKGSGFSVSQKTIVVDEGKIATVTAKAGGAQKFCWILKRGGQETIAAVNRLVFAFDAGRVEGDESLTLQFKAVYANTVKAIDIPVTIREEIPEPVLTLKAPRKWDGRDTIEIVPQISNLKKMKAKGYGELKYDWSISGLAVIKEIKPEKLILERAQNSGKLTITATISNGGAGVPATATILVKEPKKDAWVERTPVKDEKPEDNQFYARNDKNEGMLYCNGTLEQPADSLFLKLYADDKLIKTLKQKPTAKKGYAFTVNLKPGLIKYRIELGAKNGGTETILHKAGNIVCGDAYIIEGQSNALATDTHEESPLDTNEWIRSYAHPRHYRKGEAQNLWCYPVWKAQGEHKAELGWWGMALAKQLLESQKIPIFIINGAAGGTRIDQHQRSKTDPSDLNTIYGRLLWRVRQARMTHGIRAVLWHQGESDQGADGPDGGYGWESYQRYFIEMSASWKRDFPNIQHYYTYQIWPNSCSMGNGHGNMMREVQRTLPSLYSNMDVMSTLGIKPPGPCHFPLVGWTEFARIIRPLIERDFYGRKVTTPVTAPDLKRVYYTSKTKDEITMEFDQPVVWKDSLISEFYLDGAKEKVASGSVSGNVVTLKLKEPSAAQKITYLHEINWSQERLLVGKNGIAALTFCDVALESSVREPNTN